MSTYVLARLLHVICAVLGGGLVVAVAIVASRAKAEASLTSLLARLTRWASIGLAATFLTGIGVDVATGGALHGRGWFRLAGISMLICGALLGVVRRRVGRALSGAAEASALGPVPGLAWAASAVVAWITVLMELRPF